MYYFNYNELQPVYFQFKCYKKIILYPIMELSKSSYSGFIILHKVQSGWTIIRSHIFYTMNVQLLYRFYILVSIKMNSIP